MWRPWKNPSGCSYLCTSLLDITHKRLVLGNVGIGVPDRIGQDIGAVARGQAVEPEVPGDCNLFHHFPTNSQRFDAAGDQGPGLD